MPRCPESGLSTGVCNIAAAGRPTGPSLSSEGRGVLPVRVIGAPVGLTLPRITNLPVMQVFRSDNQPAAKLALSMLRLDLIGLRDWSSNAASILKKGLTRYCDSQGLKTASRVFSEGTVGFVDDLSRLDCFSQPLTSCASSTQMLLVVYYASSVVVPIGAALKAFRTINETLSDAFYEVVRHNLGRWMRTYDYTDALYLAESQIEMMGEDEARESYYPEVKKQCQQWMPKKLPSYKGAVKLLQKFQPHLKCSHLKKLISLALKMHERGNGYDTAWPAYLRDVVPGMEHFLENTDQPGPGALIVFEEDDLVSGCFDEEMQYLGNDYAIGPSLMLRVDLGKPDKDLDAQVTRMFAHIGAMLNSLAIGAELILAIRKTNAEDLRRRRLEPRVQTVPGAAAVPE